MLAVDHSVTICLCVCAQIESRSGLGLNQKVVMNSSSESSSTSVTSLQSQHAVIICVPGIFSHFELNSGMFYTGGRLHVTCALMPCARFAIL